MRVGKALSAQRFFHDVSYETQLVDSSIYVYEFTNHTIYAMNTQNERSVCSIDGWSESDSHQSTSTWDLQNENNVKTNFPNGIITDLTNCYVPTCWDIKPCYSPSCPKRLSQVNM